MQQFLLDNFQRFHARGMDAYRKGDMLTARVSLLIPEFLAQVDGLQGRQQGLLLLGATNRPWDMDEAALRPGRFGELIYVPLPDEPARRAIIAATLKNLPIAPEVDVPQLAAQTDGLSGADLVGLCEIAKDGPYEREITTQTSQRIESADLDTARQRFRASVTPALLARYDKFRQGMVPGL